MKNLNFMERARVGVDPQNLTRRLPRLGGKLSVQYFESLQFISVRRI
jgi:hypothetical protein